MEVDVEVNESDIVRVGMNDEAEVEVDAYLDETFLGTVTEIGNTALNAGLNGFAMDQVTNFSVKVRLQPESYAELLTTLEDAASPFRPGMSAKVTPHPERRRRGIGAHSIGHHARIKTDEEEDELGVFVLDKGSRYNGWKPASKTTATSKSRRDLTPRSLSRLDRIKAFPHAGRR